MRIPGPRQHRLKNKTKTPQRLKTEAEEMNGELGLQESIKKVEKESINQQNEEVWDRCAAISPH